MKHSQSGFTLIELLVVVSIIGLIASITFISLVSVRRRARDSRRLADIHTIQTALNLYYAGHGAYPVHATPWTCLGHASTESCWNGIFTGDDAVNAALLQDLPIIPDDPRNNTSCWGDAYAYYSDGQAAHLHWYYEDSTAPTNRACGRGYWGGVNACGNWCQLDF